LHGSARSTKPQKIGVGEGLRGEISYLGEKVSGSNTESLKTMRMKERTK